MAINQTKLNKIVDYARLAPSVHNTQPWLFSFGKDKITIHINDKKTLNSGDPVGRQLWISIGCCVETVVTAASFYGLSANVNDTSDNYVAISFTQHTQELPNKQKQLLEAINQRFTDRSSYNKKPISKKTLAVIKNIKAVNGTKVVVTDNPEVIEKVARLTEKGIRLALSNPDFRNELSEFIVPPFSKRNDGIPTSSLRLNNARGLIELVLIKFGLNINQHAKKEYKTWLSSSALVFVMSKGDSKEHWLNAGRTYMRVALKSTSLGLRSATSAAVVEAADFHEEVEETVNSKMRVQTVMRLGNSSSQPVHSPRLSSNDLFLH